jgi:hypothetical protein
MDMLPSFADPANLQPSIASIGLEDDPDSIELPPGALSLEFLQAIYRSADQPMARRMKAASIAIQYESPKLAVTVQVNDEGMAARLQRCIARSNGAEAYRLIEAAPLAPSNGATAQEVSAAAQRRPMTLIRRR